MNYIHPKRPFCVMDSYEYLDYNKFYPDMFYTSVSEKCACIIIKIQQYVLYPPQKTHPIKKEFLHFRSSYDKENDSVSCRTAALYYPRVSALMAVLYEAWRDVSFG